MKINNSNKYRSLLCFILLFVFEIEINTKAWISLQDVRFSYILPFARYLESSGFIHEVPLQLFVL